MLNGDTVELSTTVVSPPTQEAQNDTHRFTFTNSSVAVFTNSDGSLGSITFASAPNLVSSPSAILSLQYWSSNNNNTGVLVLDEGVFTNYSGFGTSSQTATQWGVCVLVPFSPVAAMLWLGFTDDGDAGQTNYVELGFSTSNSGAWSGAFFDSSGNETLDTGGFKILGATYPPVGLAPMSIAGQTWGFTSQGGNPTSATFGANTYSKFDASTNDQSSVVGDYTYIKTGANTAEFVTTVVAPPSNVSGPALIKYVEFSSASHAVVISTNSEGTVKSTAFAISTANSFAPASLAGKSFSGSEGGTVSFGSDGTVTVAQNGETKTGAYTYSQFSPVCGMVVISWTSGSSSGNTGYLQVQFTSPTSGDAFETDYDPSGAQLWIYSGAFTER